jgi:hypothetical protein
MQRRLQPGSLFYAIKVKNKHPVTRRDPGYKKYPASVTKSKTSLGKAFRHAACQAFGHC